jgi:hypothetical protein
MGPHGDFLLFLHQGTGSNDKDSLITLHLVHGDSNTLGTFDDGFFNGKPGLSVDG